MPRFSPRFNVPSNASSLGLLPVSSLLALGIASGVSAGDVESAINVLSSTGEISADAYASDFKSGEEASEWFIEDLDAAPAALPIISNQSATASLAAPFASGYANAAASLVNGLLSVSADAAAEAYGDGFSNAASGAGSAYLGIRFTVLRPIWAEVELGGATEMGGGNDANFNGGPVNEGVTDYDQFMGSYMLYPGIIYTLSCGAGAGANDFDALSPYASSSGSVRTLVEYEGWLQMGDNAFDTTGASGTFDMTGECDPGEFGADTIESPVFFTFNAPSDGTYTFSTCNQTALDTRIAITDYSPTPDRVIACGDEAPGCANYTTRVSVDLDADVNYTVVLGGTFTGTGDGTITVSLFGDLNEDGSIDGADLGVMLGAWGTDGGDLNEDGTTDGADFGILLALFGS